MKRKSRDVCRKSEQREKTGALSAEKQGAFEERKNMEAIVKSYAKINLTLDVKGKDGGYHLLSSLAVSAAPSDLVRVRLRTDGKITLSCPEVDVPPEKNNAYRAAELFFGELRAQFPEKFFGCDIAVEKRIPLMGGLGGSSADECGVIAALKLLTGFMPQGIERKMTSDGAFMSVGGAGIMEGRGERVRFLPYVPLNLVLLPGNSGVSAAECFALSDALQPQPPATEGAEKAYLAGDVVSLGKALKNDLTPAAVQLLPEISARLSALRETGARGVSMTGSGSAVFGLYENEDAALIAQKMLQVRYPRAAAVKTVPCGTSAEVTD